MGIKHSRKERHDAILSMLRSYDFVSAKSLINQFGCSISTIRSDLEFLEDQGLLVRTLGGAKLVWAPMVHAVQDRLSEQTKSKKNIAEYVADNLIAEYSTIVLDAGTTAFEVACVIAARDMNVSVLTCSHLVTCVLTKCVNTKLYSFGGFYNTKGGYFYDDSMREAAKLLHADIFFMGVNGVSPEAGFTIAYRDEATIKATLMNISSNTIVLCDSTKLLQNGCRVVADFKTVNTLVTDSTAPQDVVANLKRAGLTVHIANKRDI